jgi:hypothetical protein
VDGQGASDAYTREESLVVEEDDELHLLDADGVLLLDEVPDGSPVF